MICKNCGYINRDGVEFCRHCGISLKEKSRRAVKVRASVKKPDRYDESYEEILSPRKIQPKTREEEEDGITKSGKNFKAEIITIGIFVIACVTAFCIFVFDLIELPVTGGSITVNLSAAPAVSPSPEPTSAFTPVPTVASSDASN